MSCELNLVDVETCWGRITEGGCHILILKYLSFSSARERLGFPAVVLWKWWTGNWSSKSLSYLCVIRGSTISSSRMFVAGEWLWCFFPLLIFSSIFDGFFPVGTLMLIVIVWENFMLVSVCGHKLSMNIIFNYWLESLWKNLVLWVRLVLWGTFTGFLFSISVLCFCQDMHVGIQKGDKEPYAVVQWVHLNLTLQGVWFRLNSCLFWKR